MLLRACCICDCLFVGCACFVRLCVCLYLCYVSCCVLVVLCLLLLWCAVDVCVTLRFGLCYGSVQFYNVLLFLRDSNRESIV